MDVEQRARELLAAQYRKEGANPAACELMAGRASWPNQMALNAIIAALTPPEGSDQSLLELAATFETCIPFLPSAGQRNIGKAVAQLRHMAMGYVLVPVEVKHLYDFMAITFTPFTGQHQQIKIQLELARKAMLAARPEVKP